MNEKRFKLSDWCGEQNVSNVIDIEKQTHLINVEVVDLLNEQQATITALQDEIVQLKRQNKALKDSSLTDAYFDYLENSRTFTLKVAEEPIRVTKYEELFDDE